MEILRKNILDTFKSYVDGFCGIGPGVNLKYAHSLRVAALSERIAQSLSMEKEDIDLAWLIGILHDIGRFEQLRRYQTFFDYRSMDHAKYGVHVLFEEGHIKDFIASSEENDVIRAAIGEHNVYEVGGDLSKRELHFARLIRDADKLDIFRVYVMYREKNINVWNVDWSDLEKQSISDSVMAQARARRLVKTQSKATFMDFYVGALCFYFDLNFPISRKIAWEEGNYAKLLDFHSQNPESEQKLDEIRELVHAI